MGPEGGSSKELTYLRIHCVPHGTHAAAIVERGVEIVLVESAGYVVRGSVACLRPLLAQPWASDWAFVLVPADWDDYASARQLAQ